MELFLNIWWKRAWIIHENAEFRMEIKLCQRNVSYCDLQSIEEMAKGWAYERRWIEWFAISITSIFIRDYFFITRNFLSLSDKESVIVNSAITVHNLRRKAEIKIVSVLTRLPSSLVSWCSLNCLNGWDRETIFGVECWAGCTQK